MRSGENAAGRLPPRRARFVRPWELWGRRTTALGIVLVGAAVVGGIVLLAAGSENEGTSGSGTGARVERLQEKLLDKTVVDPAAGISVRRPDSWTDSKGRGAIILRSENRCVSMTLAAPAQARDAKKLIRDSISGLRDTYPGIRIRQTGRNSLGGIPTSSFTAALRNKRGDEIRVLLSVGTGRKYAYVADVILGNTKCRADLAAAQLILTSVEYTK
jgi:hypothetical protein